MRNPEQRLMVAEEQEQRRRAEQKRKRLEREEAQKAGKLIADQVRAKREAAARGRR